MGEDEKYICWGDDAEDLTNKVLAAKVVNTTAEFFTLDAMSSGTRKSKPWRVVVTCSKGHRNVFSDPR